MKSTKKDDSFVKTIVFVGSNKFGTSYEALITAKKMGYYTVLLTDKNNYDFFEVDKIIYLKDLLNIKTCIEVISKLQEDQYDICACLSLIDPFVSHSAKPAQYFNINVMSIESLHIMENKIRFRDKLQNLSSSPFYTTINKEIPLDGFINQFEELLPLVVKPAATNGSKDVLYVGSIEELNNAIHLIQKKHPEYPVLVEEYLSGPQYLIEVLVYKNELNIVGVIAQEFSKNGLFIITDYQFPTKLNDIEISTLMTSVQEIISALGFSNGSCHLEMRHVNGLWKLIEINPRIAGGAMNRVIEEGTGINLIKEVIKLHLGEAPSLIKTKNEHVYAKYLTIRSRGKLLKVTGKDEALKHDGVKYVFVKPLEGKIITTPSTMGHRYACIIAASNTAVEAKSIALAAARKIRFYLEPF